MIETLHRDRLMAIFQQRGWDPLEDDAVLLEERDFDYVAGEGDESHLPLGRRAAERDLPCAATRRPSW